MKCGLCGVRSEGAGCREQTSGPSLMMKVWVYGTSGKRGIALRMHRLLLLLIVAVNLPGLCMPHPSNRARNSDSSYLQITCRKYSLNSAAIPRASLESLNRPVSRTYKDADGAVWQATPRGLVKINPTDGQEKVLTGKNGLPILSVTGIAGGPNGRLWLTSNQGAILYMPNAVPKQRWFYFWGQRYLSDNEVLQIVAVRNGAWIRTRTGISRIELQPFTLEQKSEIFLTRIRKRHNRYGYVADCELLRAGDPASFRMESTDNDGLWTSIFAAAESFRYATTHSPEALKNARTSLAALLRLVSITRIPRFPARSLIHRGDYLAPGGEWHWTANSQWKWKGDTSSDELVGHFFAYWVAYNLLPDNGDRAAIRKAVFSIASGLLEHHLQLIGYGGHVTTWGRYNPEYLKTLVSRERALDSLELLSHLRVAYAITGDKKFLDGYRRIGSELGYVQNVMYIGDDTDPANINYSDEELAFLSFYPLLSSESNPKLRQQYEVALTKLWQRVRNENNPLWNFMYAEGTGAKAYDCTESLEALKRIPLSTISWTVKNSQRHDLVIAGHMGRFGEAQSRNAIPPDERSVMKWNGNPFQLDGGDGGRSEDDGSFFLLPYWFGRYHHLIPCPQ